MKKQTTRNIVFKHIRQYFPDDERWDNEEWIKSDDLIKELDKVWHKINTCKMDKLRNNFITKTQVASYLSELRDALAKKHQKETKEK